MKIVVIAKYGLQVTTPKKTVTIAKGDKFDLYGKVFLYDGVIIDITQYPEAFEYVKDDVPAWPMTFEFTAPLIVTKSDGTKVTFDKGMQFKAVSDIVFIKGVALDIAKYNYCIKYVPEDEPEPEPAEKQDAEIAWPSESASVNVGDAIDIVLANPHNLPIAYESSDSNVIAITDAGVMTTVGAGVATIKASFAGDDTYNEAEVTIEITVNVVKTDPVLNWSEDAATCDNIATFIQPTLNNPAGLNVSYESTDTAVATVNEAGQATVLANGSTTIKAIFAGNDSLNAKTAEYVLTVNIPAGE